MNRFSPQLNKSALSSKTKSRRFRLGRNGTTAVEFAMVFPIVLAFFIAMTVFTQAFTMRDTAQHAAYEGAREGLKIESSAQDCEQAVQDFLKSMGLKNGKVIVSPATLDTLTNEVTVAVAVPFQDNAWVGGGFMPKDWMATSEITLSRFRKKED